MKRWLRASIGVAVMTVAAASASAQDWRTLATISTTLGTNANRLCIGEGLRVGDIGCPIYAPVDPGPGGLFVRNGATFATGHATNKVGNGTLYPSATLHVQIPSATTGLLLQTDYSYTVDSPVGEVFRIRDNAGNTTHSFSMYAGDGTMRTQYANGNAIYSEMSTIGGNNVLYKRGGGSLNVITMSDSDYDWSIGRFYLGGKNLSIGKDVWNAPGAMMTFNHYTNGIGIGTVTPTATLQISGSMIVSTTGQTTTPTLHAGTNGRVGVGTSAPDQVLHVYKSGVDAKSSIRLQRGHANSSYLTQWSYSSGTGFLELSQNGVIHENGGSRTQDDPSLSSWSLMMNNNLDIFSIARYAPGGWGQQTC